MTQAQRDLVAQWRAVFCPSPAIKARRQTAAVSVVAQVAGALVPWALAALFVWTIGTWMTRWNVGL